jgi:outer membrane receptor protein involved in Fe transport
MEIKFMQPVWKSKPRALNLSICAALISVSSTVTAQTSADKEKYIEEIIVTATYRETDLMNTPLAISALSEDMIAQQIFPGSFGPSLDLTSPVLTPAPTGSLSVAFHPKSGLAQPRKLMQLWPRTLTIRP